MADLVSQVRVAFEEAFRRGLAAVDPRAAVRAELATGQLEIGQIEGPVTLVAIGKAAPSMAHGAVEVLRDRVARGVIVSPDHQAETASSRLRYLEGGHPIPTVASLHAGRIVMTQAADATGTLLVLISGGASALAEVPIESLTLTDLVATYQLLLRAGLPIEQINTVRRHLSALKNGGLLAAARVPTVTLMIADVVGADASAIGSGPTLADSTTPADALTVATDAGILETLPKAVLEALRGPGRPPTSSPPHRWAIVTDGTIALRAAADHLRRFGLNTTVDPTPLTGDAAEQGRHMASEALPLTITVRHGETVVKVRGDSPGGRNQHAALAAALVLQGQSAVFAALASDGRDGLTEAAGAIVDGQTCQRMRAGGLDPEEMLAECRSHDALAAAGDLVITGPTGTNVADIWMSWRQE
jgi:hydroxypyruvate reductase